MSKNNSHSGKSKYQKENYKKFVTHSNYEQTVDESFDFDKSDSTKILERSDDKVQKAPFTSNILDYCKEHVVGTIFTIICTIIIGVFSFNTIQLNRESGEHSIDIANIKETVSDIKINITSVSETINNVQIINAEQSKDIEYIQKAIEKIDKEIDKIQSSISK